MLKIKNLSKKFDKTHEYAIKDCSFSVNEREIVGLIGKNGAGKTTLMKLIAKSLKPTTGDILLNGKSILDKPNSLKDFGFMIEGSVFSHLSAIEHLKFFIELNGEKEDNERIEEVLKLVDLWRVKDKNPTSFSFGMKQRLSLAICLITSPKILILDEPFVGLDPIGVDNLINSLKQWVSKENSAIIISSHQLSELESICTRYLFIENGVLESDFVQNGSQTLSINVKDNIENIVDILQKYKHILSIKNEEILVNQKSKDFNEFLKSLLKVTEIEKIESLASIRNKFKGEEYE